MVVVEDGAPASPRALPAAVGAQQGGRACRRRRPGRRGRAGRRRPGPPWRRRRRWPARTASGPRPRPRWPRSTPPGGVDRPLSLSTRPMAASTLQSSPGTGGGGRLVERHPRGRHGRPAASPTRGPGRPPAPSRGPEGPGHHGHAAPQGTDAATSRRPPRRADDPAVTSTTVPPRTERSARARSRTPRSAERSPGGGRTTLQPDRTEGDQMRSTMQDGPLLISGILRHGQPVHGDSPVVTVEADGTEPPPSPRWPSGPSGWPRP